MNDKTIKAEEGIKKTRIILADVSPIMRQALITCIERQHDMEVIGEAGDGEEAVELATKLMPDVLVIDIDLPVIDGIEATKQVIEQCSEIDVLVFTAHDDNENISRIIKSGASGYLMKRASGEVIIHVIRRIAVGERVFPSTILEGARGHAFGQRRAKKNTSLKLTSRELMILRLLANGMQNKDIAIKLGLSLPYVKSNLAMVYIKLGASTRTEAISIGMKMGILSVDDLMNI